MLMSVNLAGAANHRVQRFTLQHQHHIFSHPLEWEHESIRKLYRWPQVNPRVSPLMQIQCGNCSLNGSSTHQCLNM